MPPGRRHSLTRVAIGVLLPILLLTTCTGDTMVSPGGTVRSQMDVTGLFRAGDEFGIPVDRVDLTLTRVSDNSVAFSRTLTAAEYASSGGNLVITVDLTLDASPEDFTFLATVFSGGVEYYRATGNVTAIANQSVSTAPLTPVYTGPGANADGLSIPPSTYVGLGQTQTLNAVVTRGGTPVTGVPVAFGSSDSSLIVPTSVGFSQADVTAPATGSGSVTITAKTPNGLTATGIVYWPLVSGPPSSVTANSALTQTTTVSSAVAAPPSVIVRDALGNLLTGVSVAFAVASGGGSLTGPATIATVAGGIATVGGWTVGPTPGSNTVTATVAGLPAVTFTATGVASVPTTVTANSALTQSATVNTGVGARPSVVVRDAGGAALGGVNVTFAITAGGGALTGPATVVTNGSGIATVGGWTVGQTAGANTLTATVTGLTPVSFTATGTAGAATTVALISGDAQTGPAGSVLPLPLVVEPRDAFGNPVPGVTVTWATPDGGSFAPASGPTNASGRAQTNWTLGVVATTQTATATVAGLAPVSFTATVGLPQIVLGFPGIPGVGIGKTVTVRATIPGPAPAGGVAVTMTSDAPGTASVPGTPVTIPQGQTTADFTVTGVATGTTTLRGNATGYTEGTLSIDVQVRSISVPTTLSVAFGQTASLPINIGAPAPAGGVVIDVVSDNPTAVGIQTATVTIPAGALAANAIVQGLLPGVANVTVSNPAYDADVSAVTTSASLNIIQGSASLNASFGTTIDLRFESSGAGISAPAGGVTITLVATDPTCLATNSPRTITSGLVTTTADLSYGGTAPLPCTTKLLATAPNIQPDSINVTVNAIPQITLSAPIVGSGLQVSASVNLNASNHGGVTVRIQSTDSAVVLVSPDATTPGSGTLDVFVPNGTGSFSYYVQGVELATGTPALTATAPGFASGTNTATVQQPAFELQGVPTATTTFSADNPIYVQVGLSSGVNASLYTVQNVRAGAPGPLTVTFTAPDPAVGALVNSTGTNRSFNAQIVPGLYYTPTTVATGGVSFRPLGSGTTTLTTSLANYIATTNSARTVTVAAPQITVSAPIVGSGLQVGASVNLGASNHGGVTVHVVSSDPAVLLISPDATTPGSAFIDVPLLNGTGSFSYYVQGVEQGVGTPTITASATGFTDGTNTATVQQPAFELQGLPATTTTATGDNALYAQVGLSSGVNSSLYTVQNVRAGAPAPLRVSFTVQDPLVGTLLDTTGVVTTTTAEIPSGLYYTPTTVATGGVAFRPLSGGTTTVTTALPTYIATTAATRSITVAAPQITMSAPTVGGGLQTSASVNLGASNHGGVTVHLVSADPAVALVSSGATTPGTAFIDVPVPNGSGSFSYYVQGVEGATGTPLITASATGFTSGSNTATVQQAAYEIQGLTTATNTFAADNPFYVQVGLSSGVNTSLYTVQNVRAGAPGPLIVTLTSSIPAVGTLVTSAGSGASRTVQIPSGLYYSPTSVATGGVAFNVLLGGTTDVTALIPNLLATTSATRTVTVSAPGMTLGNSTVGSGLQANASVSLGTSNHGGVIVHLASSQPGVALVSPDATTPGTASIDVTVPNGNGSFSYYVQGVEQQTGTVQITATAPGFTNGTANADIQQPAFEIQGLTLSTTTFAPDNPFYVQVGLSSGLNTSLYTVQNVRAGAPGPLTVNFNSATPGVGTLVTSAGSGANATAQIPSGLYYTPTTVATGGVALDALTAGTTVVTATLPNYIVTAQATRTVSVATSYITNNGTTVGAGLQQAVSLNLNGSNHPDFTVHIVSATPGALLVAPNATTPGTASIDVPLSNGQTSITYYVQGVDGAAGNAVVTASAPGFTDGLATSTVVQPAVEIVSLPTSVSAAAAVTPFYVQVGLANINQTALQSVQNVRAGSSLTATLTSQTPAVGQLTTLTGSGATETVTIPANLYYSPTNVAGGGVAFDGLTPGLTAVVATIPNFMQINSATVAVTVTP